MSARSGAARRGIHDCLRHRPAERHDHHARHRWCPDLADPGTCIDRFNGQASRRPSLRTQGRGARHQRLRAGGTVTAVVGSDRDEPGCWVRPKNGNCGTGPCDGHPIHLHLVKFKVLNREVIRSADRRLSG